jgi:hypothetical protein
MLISGCLLLIYLTFYFFQVYRRKSSADAMKANMISMVLGMANGLLIGLVLGFLLQGHLALSTIWAILISLIIGFVIGIPFGEIAAVEALCAGLMGGMMGAMLGEMLPSGDWKMMILFMNILYILSMSVMMQWLWNKGKVINLKQSYTFLLSAVIPILIVSSITFFDRSGLKDPKTQNNHPMQHEMHMNQ